jgi:GNAT superfamily N-acetyltransferase
MLKFDCREIRFGPADHFTETEHQLFKALTDLIWPVAPGKTPHERTPDGERPERTIAAVWDGDRVIALSESFRRTILTTAGPLDILALSKVCVLPDYRRLGYGEAVARAQFARVDRGEFPLALFQTRVPDFYARLGATVVERRVRNSRHPTNPEESPFWAPCLVVYPATAHLPEGVIDLNGLGY